MDKSFFNRPFRAVHRFGANEERAAIDGTFPAPKPMIGRDHSSLPMTVQNHGSNDYMREPLSAVEKPNRQLASFQGAQPKAPALADARQVFSALPQRRNTAK